jgi:AraC-like DNA-binding protein/mannose-6-phosphate isomerase-like protein (cupin superfamily)
MLIAKRSTYHPPSVIANSGSFEICRLEQRDLPDISPDIKGRISSHYEIIWILKGEGNLWLNHEKQRIPEGAISCIKPNLWHKLEAEGILQGFVLSFNEPFLGIGDHEIESGYRSALISVFESEQPLLTEAAATADMQEIAEKLQWEFDNADLFRTEILQRYLKVFLVYLARQFEQRCSGMFRQKRMVGLVERFFSLLTEDIGIKRTVGDYARQLFVTPNYLNEMIKKNTGHSAGYHIRQRIILEVKRMVTFAGAPTKEVAYALGFSDMAHFSRFFKQNAGLNFSDFKKAYMNTDNG